MAADLPGVPNCAFHSDVDSSGLCVSCGRRLCERCIEIVNGAELCKLCKERTEAARHVRSRQAVPGSVPAARPAAGIFGNPRTLNILFTAAILLPMIAFFFHGFRHPGEDHPWTVWFFVWAIGVGALAGGLYGRHKKKLWDELFKTLALRFSGRCDPRRWGVYPNVRIPLKGLGGDGCFTYYSTGGKHAQYYTDFIVGISGGAFRLEIYPEGFLSQVGKWFGMQDIQTGDARLDAAFIIKSDNAAAARRFLSDPEVGAALLELKRLRENQAVSLESSGAEFRVRKLSFIEDAAEAEVFIRKSCMLFEKISPLMGGGPAVETASAPQALSASPRSRVPRAAFLLVLAAGLIAGGWNIWRSTGVDRMVRIAREGKIRLYGVPNEINTLQTLERFMLRKVRAKFIPVDLADDAAVQALSDRVGKKTFNLPIVEFDGDFRDFRDLAQFFREFPLERPLKPLKKKPYIVMYGPSDCEQVAETERELDAAGLPWEFRDLNANPEHPAVAFSRLEAYGWPMDEKVYFPIVDVNGNIWDRPSLEHIRRWYAEE